MKIIDVIDLAKTGEGSLVFLNCDAIKSFYIVHVLMYININRR